MKKAIQIAAILFGFLFALVTLAQAQTIDGYRLNVYATGATAPTSFFEFTTTATVCNQAPPTIPPGVPVNPSQVIWDDPANAGKICEWTDPGTGPLLATPVGAAYEATLQAYNAAGRGPESNRAPFSRLAPPTTAPAGFKLRRLGS